MSRKKSVVTQPNAHDAAVVATHYACQAFIQNLQPRSSDLDASLKEAIAVASIGAQAYIAARNIILREGSKRQEDKASE